MTNVRMGRLASLSLVVCGWLFSSFVFSEVGDSGDRSVVELMRESGDGPSAVARRQ